MTSSRVPFAPLGQRLWRLAGTFAWVFAVMAAVRITLGPDPVFLLAALVLAMLSGVLATNWWMVRSGSELVSPGDRERRAAAEIANRPLWHLVLPWTVSMSVFIPSLVFLFATEGESLTWDYIEIVSRTTAVMFPLIVAAGFAIAYSTRGWARSRLARVDSDDSPDYASLWRARNLANYFFILIVAFAVACLVGVAAGLLLQDPVAEAAGFILGFGASLLCSLWLTGRLAETFARANRPLRADSFTFARATFFALWFGAPLALLITSAALIVIPGISVADLAWTFLLTLAYVVGLTLFLWAFVQAFEWTPR